MKKTVLAVVMGAMAASGSAFAGTVTDVETSVYGGAEIGGNFLMDDQAGDDVTFANEHKVFVGAEISKKVQKDVSVFVGAEAEYTFGGEDEDILNLEDGEATVTNFVVGADTVAGRTTLGIQKGIADEFDGFADLSMEHGLEDHGFAAAIGDHNFVADAKTGEVVEAGQETLQHVTSYGPVSGGLSYDFDTEAVAVAAQAELPKGLTLGAAYVDGGIAETKAYTLGAEMSVKQIDLAAKYSVSEDAAGVDGDAYAVSAAYGLNEKVRLAGSYNVEGDDYVMAGAKEDDYFTVGASYQATKNVELVTDYKFASEADDQLFVRANITF